MRDRDLDATNELDDDAFVDQYDGRLFQDTADRFEKQRARVRDKAFIHRTSRCVLTDICTCADVDMHGNLQV